MAADASRLRNWLNDAAMANGFHSVHVTAATLPETTGTHLRQFIAQGFAGDMRWLADTAARRSQPRARRRYLRWLSAYGCSGSSAGCYVC